MALALLTDLYQLTMLNGYYAESKHTERCHFELFFRTLPFSGGFAVCAGLQTALDYLEQLSFSPEELTYLRELNLFTEPFLSWLGSFQFSGDIEAIPEGELVFAHEPLLRVSGQLGEVQLVESALLNMINFQTLIATKAARVVLASQGRPVFEFGLRRAQGVDGALSASRASFLGGCSATSNVLAGKRFGIPVVGTQAHSWIMAFNDELEAFRAYARVYPESCSLLVDTYHPITSGIPNAIRVGLELQAQGYQLQGLRLDSGDLVTQSQIARSMLDAAGLPFTKIIASSDLDEASIAHLVQEGACIDAWGVGTHLVTAKDHPALGGVYKLVATEDRDGSIHPRVKLSATPLKTTLAGIKQTWRAYDSEGNMLGDILGLYHEEPPLTALSSLKLVHHVRPLLKPAMRCGRALKHITPSLAESRSYQAKALATLPSIHKGLHDPKPYPVAFSRELVTLQKTLTNPPLH